MRYPRHVVTDGQNAFLIGYDGYTPAGSGLWIAKWDGTGFKVVERRAFSGKVMQAAYDRGRLFIGGEFNYVGETRADNIAMWDGSRWHAFTQGANPGVAGYPEALLSWNGKSVFSGKGIATAGPKRAAGIAAWDGTGFETFGRGVPNKVILLDSFPYLQTSVACLAGAGDNLYAAGIFDTAGTRAVNNVTRWDGVEWSRSGMAFPGRSRACSGRTALSMP